MHISVGGEKKSRGVFGFWEKSRSERKGKNKKKNGESLEGEFSEVLDREEWEALGTRKRGGGLEWAFQRKESWMTSNKKDERSWRERKEAGSFG